MQPQESSREHSQPSHEQPQQSSRKPASMSWEDYVEQQIQAAQDAGKFDNLPGFGRRSELIDQPPEQDWWLKRKLKEEQLNCLPPALEIRRDVHETLGRLRAATDEADVRRELEALNRRIDRANFAAWWGPPSDTARIDVERWVASWRQESDRACSSTVDARGSRSESRGCGEIGLQRGRDAVCGSRSASQTVADAALLGGQRQATIIPKSETEAHGGPDLKGGAMLLCPVCRSDEVRPSRSRRPSWPLRWLVLAIRCHNCGRLFHRFRWSISLREQSRSPAQADSPGSGAKASAGSAVFPSVPAARPHFADASHDRSEVASLHSESHKNHSSRG